MLPHIVLLHILYVSFNFDHTGALRDGSRYRHFPLRPLCVRLLFICFLLMCFFILLCLSLNLDHTGALHGRSRYRHFPLRLPRPSQRQLLQCSGQYFTKAHALHFLPSSISSFTCHLFLVMALFPSHNRVNISVCRFSILLEAHTRSTDNAAASYI